MTVKLTSLNEELPHLKKWWIEQKVKDAVENANIAGEMMHSAIHVEPVEEISRVFK